MHQVGGGVFAQRASSKGIQRKPSGGAGFQHKRAAGCSAKGKKNRKQQSKQFSGDALPSEPDTASLHLQYASMLGISPEVAMKRVLEGASTIPYPAHNYKTLVS